VALQVGLAAGAILMISFIVFSLIANVFYGVGLACKKIVNIAKYLLNL